ncbi:AIPR family protein [Pararhodospirillum oryzae]|uniref:Abortive phage infection protein n=1 Tax=Pararhodospirillum oryzae TaxID=478448 RepID=A0A512HAY2_9PROT|nr:AIPR family protein [Pararhodospirillum oryzae]GEO82616.1 hypothetical protein ROR02_27470 [Pararhodospirillum oryzae]
MELLEFLMQTQAEVREAVSQRMGMPGEAYPYPEIVFAEVVMQHMSEIGMTFEPIICHFSGRIGNAQLRLSGYSVSEEADQLDLFVSLYDGVDELTSIPDGQAKKAADQCLRFLARCADGKMQENIDESHEAYSLAVTIRETYPRLDQVRIYVLTDRIARTRNFRPREEQGKTIKLEVMDIERLFRHLSAGKPRDELTVDFTEVAGAALPCVYVPGEQGDYDYALTTIPGEVLRFLYEKYGARLLEANVRSFLSATGKVNRGIRDTLKMAPNRFMAYNNGIVVIADDIRVARSEDGGTGIAWLKGMQIVNGGQTTASLYFTKKRDPSIDLGPVRVPAKMIILHSVADVDEEALISDISRYANSQNAVRVSDLSANRPYHVELEKLAATTYLPDGEGRWFYERAAGSYKTMLAHEGTSPARLRKLKEEVPAARKITKTDLAKFLNAWDRKPHMVSRGAQKNFEAFMEELAQIPDLPLPDVRYFKQAVARAILFKSATRRIRKAFPAFQANVTAYTIAILSLHLGDRVDFDRIWLDQEISPELGEQIDAWAMEVNNVLRRTSNGRMISEWAKRPECWEEVKDAEYSAPKDDIPDVRKRQATWT